MKIRFLNLLLIGSIVSSVMLSSCEKDETNPNDDKVQCTITQPQDNDTLRIGTTVSIVAEADYTRGTIVETRFFVDEVGIGSSSEFPYKYDWETDNEVSGWHTIKAEAKGNDGASGTDEKKILLVGNVTRAFAGNDTIIEGGSTSLTLSANEPEFDYETAYWVIASGSGGSFADSTKANTVFTGKLNTSYLLIWTIENKYYSSSDELRVLFRKIEYGSVTDYDGNTYKTVTIGNQTWMAENLKVTHQADGTAIPLVTDDTDWGNLGANNTDKAYCYYDNSNANRDTYGALYTYAAAKDACPTGWHLPTDAEWSTLETYISNDGHSGTVGTALKSTTGWNGDGNGTDYYGFSALPGGGRNDNGSFNDLGDYGRWWSATEGNSDGAYGRHLNYGSAGVYRDYNGKSSGFSVRCVRD